MKNSLLILLFFNVASFYKLKGLLFGTRFCSQTYSDIECKKFKLITVLNFKKQKDINDGTDENRKEESPLWEGIKKFLPNVSRAKIEKSYAEPIPDSGYRYEVRLVEANSKDRRHIITRIIRYLPDLNWETVEDIVDTSILDGKSLVRVFNSMVK